MSDELILRYETDAKSGIPTLKVQSGTLPFDDAELSQVERELRPRYERLARGSAGSVTLRSHTFSVETQAGPDSRQPTLVLRLERVSPPGVAQTAAPAWPEGFFRELRQLAEAEAEKPLSPLEKGALILVLEELRWLTAEKGVNFGGLLLTAYLATAEQDSRDGDEARAGVYVLALRGLSRILPDRGDASEVPDSQLSNAQVTKQETRRTPRLGRLFGRLTGSPETDNGNLH
jgi:hypothetical protein